MTRAQGQAATALIIVAALLALAGFVVGDQLDLSEGFIEACRAGAFVVGVTALGRVALVRSGI